MTRTETLNNPRDFFDKVTRPNYNDFFNDPSSFKTAFSLAMSLFNLHEWIFEFNKSELENEFGKTFQSPAYFWREVESQVPEAAFIRDLSNASKHVKLTIYPSTSMTHIANTAIRTASSYGESGYGRGRYSASSVVFHSDENEIYLDDCAKKLFDFWEALLDKFYPLQSSSIVLNVETPPSANS